MKNKVNNQKNNQEIIKQINELKKQIEELNKQIIDLKNQSDDFKNKYLRALADYQNLEKRIIEEKKELIKIANNQLILKLLPFLDNLEKAEIFIKDTGLKMIREEFYKILAEFGLEELDVLNKSFDPNLAEAVDIVLGDDNDKVVEVVRKGYKIGDKVLRVAQVKVSKKIEKTS